MNFHLEINNPEECTAIENDFAEEIKKRGEDFKFYKDQVRIRNWSWKVSSLLHSGWGDWTSRSDVSPHEGSGTPGPQINRP